MTMWSNVDMSLVGEWANLETEKMYVLSKLREDIVDLVNNENANEAILLVFMRLPKMFMW